MIAILPRSVLPSLLVVGSALGSPIEELLESRESLAKASIRIELVQPDAKEPALSFKVVWTPNPAKTDAIIPPRLDLIQFGKDRNAPPRLQVRHDVDNSGQCKADFSISADAIDSTRLVFWFSQQTAYILELSHYVAGFRGLPKADSDPFEK